MNAAPPPHGTPAPAQPAVLTAWPRSAQLATAFLLGATGVLLAVNTFTTVRWRGSPSDLEAAPELAYRIDVNRASRDELMQVPNIGPALADAIVAERQRRPFADVEDLRRVHGIGDKTLTLIQHWVCAGRVEDERHQSAAYLEKTTPARAYSTKAASTTRKTVGGKRPKGGRIINLNEATEADLRELPQIGAGRAAAILKERQKGPFRSVDDLRRVKGIGPGIINQLRPYATVGGASVAKAEDG
jgi:competence protein ComEA